MERFVINPQVLCSDGSAPDDNPERRSPDVGGDAGMIQDPIPTVGIRMTKSCRRVYGPVCRRPGRVSVCFQDEYGGPDVQAGHV